MSSSSGSETERVERNGNRDERQGQELATKTIVIQSKRFYLDVKQNQRGRFIKFAEVSGSGRKSRLFMSMRVSKTVKELLDKFIEQIAKLGEDNQKSEEPTLIHSEKIFADRRRYFLDLRENNRGTFLRITQDDSYGMRLSIALPAQGVEQLRDALVELLDEFGEGYLSDEQEPELPEPRFLRIDRKTYYFDPDRNARGDFFKISEVKLNNRDRNTIIVSARALPQFTKILTELNDKLTQLRAVDAIEAAHPPGSEVAHPPGSELALPPNDINANSIKPKVDAEE